MTRQHRRSRLLAGTAVFAAASMLFAGCGGDSGSSSGSGAPADSATVSALASDTTNLGPQAAEFSSLYSAARTANEDRVVVYAGEYTLLKPVFDAFSKRFPGISVSGKDTFGSPMETTIGQEVASKPSARGDIANTADTTMLNLADKGLLQSYKPPAAVGVTSDQLVYKDNLLTGAYYDFFGNMVNTNVVQNPPQSWDDLLKPELKGKVVIADPTTAGSGNGIMTTLANDPKYGIDYARKLKANDVQLVAPGAELAAKVADGTYGVAIFAQYTVYQQLKQKGAPLSFVFPVQGGVWIPVEYSGLIKDAPHPSAAKLLMNYFYTPEAATIMTKSSQVSALPGSPTPEGIPPIARIEQLKSTPLDTRIENQNRYTEELKTVFR